MSISLIIDERVKEVAKFFIENNSTVRKTAKYFGVSKNTIHKDLTDRLPLILPEQYTKVKKILQKNKDERHIRGGNATKEKYLQMKKNSCNRNGGTFID